MNSNAHSSADLALAYRRDFHLLGGDWGAVAEKHGVTPQYAKKFWYNQHYRKGIPDPKPSTIIDFPQQQENRYDISDPLYDIPDDTHRWHKHLSELPSPLRVAFWTDMHIGKVAGKLTHDPRAIELSLKPIQDFKPHVVIVGSDQFEFDSISRFSSDFDRLAADALKEVEKPYLNVMADLRSAAPDAVLPYLIGNHDWRIDEHSRASQYRYTVVSDFVNMVRSGRALWLGWQNVAMEIRGLRVLHGRFTNKYAANKHGDFYAWDRDMLFGHCHRFDYSFRGAREVWGSGCLANVAPHYLRYPSNWQQGIVLATVYEDHAHFTPLRFKNYRTVYAGKEYRA